MQSSTNLRPVLISVVQYDEQLSSGAYDVAAAIRAARRLGADGIELRGVYWKDRQRELLQARDLVADLGLLVIYATHVTLFSADHQVSPELRQDIADARALGASLLRVFQGPAPDDDDLPGWEAGREAVRIAEAHAITLALENHARTPGCRAREIRRVLDRIVEPALATNIDIGNYARNGEDVVAAIALVGDRAVSAHLKDQRLAPDDSGATYLGGGELPLPAILDRLDQIPGRLLYCFEFQGGDDPDDRITRSLTYLRSRQSGSL
jgi:sugar phosphate isomerase/epimerase